MWHEYRLGGCLPGAYKSDVRKKCGKTGFSQAILDVSVLGCGGGDLFVPSFTLLFLFLVSSFL